jgi:hypothetical protein
VERSASALARTPRSMSRDMMKSAGTISNRPPRFSHQGAVTQRDRKWNLVREPCNNFRVEYEFDGRAFTFHDGYFQLLLCSDTPGLNEADEITFTLVRSADVTVTMTADGTVMQLSLRSTTLTLHRAPGS